MDSSILKQFLTLWVVIDPIGTVPVFIAVAASVGSALRAKLALHATIVAAGVLLGFLIAGQFIIAGLGISLLAFQIAGGIVLFLFALTMIFGESKPEVEVDEAPDLPRPELALAVFPLAMPSLASPGAMLAIVLLTDNNRFSIPEQVVTAGLMCLVLVVAYLLMRLAGPILRIIGTGGAAIVSRVMGMFLASVAVDNVLTATLVMVQQGHL